MWLSIACCLSRNVNFQLQCNKFKQLCSHKSSISYYYLVNQVSGTQIKHLHIRFLFLITHFKKCYCSKYYICSSFLLIDSSLQAFTTLFSVPMDYAQYMHTWSLVDYLPPITVFHVSGSTPSVYFVPQITHMSGIMCYLSFSD